MKFQQPSLAALVRFLIARVDEDEVELRRLQRNSHRSASSGDLPGVRSLARQRVECDVKRQVIGQAQHLLVLRDLPNEREVRDRAALVLMIMAEPYSDHLSYSREWALRPAAVSKKLANGAAARSA